MNEFFFQDQVQQMQVQLEAKLDHLLQHWNLEHKVSFLQKKDVSFSFKWATVYAFLAVNYRASVHFVAVFFVCSETGITELIGIAKVIITAQAPNVFLRHDESGGTHSHSY